MSSRLVLSGFDELRQQLRDLPGELTGEASHIVTGAVNGAEAEIKGKYARKTGDLADHLEVTTLSAGAHGVAIRLRSTAKHAYMYENGTQARHTELGANRGAMPPAHVFVPASIRARRLMYDELGRLVESKGLKVTGTHG